MKPEFRIQEQLIDNTYSQNNISVKAGELIGRLYYPKGFERSGQFSIKDKGIKVLYDSHKSSKKFSNFNNTVRVVLFVAPAATMIELYESGLFAPSNMNGAEEETKRHVQALKAAQPSAVVEEPVTSEAIAAREPGATDELIGVKQIKPLLNTVGLTQLKLIANAYDVKFNIRSRKASLVKNIATCLAKEGVTQQYVSDLVAFYNEDVA